ncbi:MAG: LysM peptidoglycan-binding domain-containing protein [Deltaproteobacteria bacterium]|nr:LysM peptidoglycan-binding domain-containing protein [Deltaproteobacteria bacterium]
MSTRHRREAVAGLLAALLGGLWATATPARAAGTRPTVMHTLQAGDTAELLAAEYYGNRQLAVFILAANGISHEQKLKVGMKLRIPTSWKYTVQAGDTLGALAQAELGDARRASYLGDVNGLASGAVLVTGAELSMPFHLRHVTAGVESYKDIARAYYGDPRKADLLKQYNFKSGASEGPNTELLIPIEFVRVRPSKLPVEDPAVAAAEAERLKDAAARVASALELARTRLRDGRFEDVISTLSLKLLSETDPGEAELAEIQWLLGNAHVALGQRTLAIEAFREVRARRPKMKLDPALISPKVRAVFAAARKPAAGGTP